MALTKVSTGMLSADAASVDLNIDADTLFIDASANRVGVANTSPATALDVTGTVTADGLTVDGSALVRSGNTLTLNRTDNATGGAMSYVAGTGFIFNDANGDGTSFNVGAANRMRIDSAGNVGIGVVPAVTQTLTAQITNGLSLFGNNTTPYGFISNNHVWATGTGDKYLVSNYGASYYKQYSGVHTWATAPSGTAGNALTFTPRMTLDASGNLMVGQTSGDSADTGHIFNPVGVAFHIRDSGVPLVVRRNTNDGELIQLKKDGTTIGSLGTHSASMYIGQGDTGLYFNNGNNSIDPYNTSTPAPRGDAISLGAASRKFTDLYLSGDITSSRFSTDGDGIKMEAGKGIKFSGYASANVLDDYEEGTWTPTIRGSANAGTYTYLANEGTYTKVGRMVSLSFYITNISVSSAGSGYIQIIGVPFEKRATHFPSGACCLSNVDIDNANSWATGEFISAGATSILYVRTHGDNIGGADLSTSSIVSGASDLRISICYEIA